MYNQAERAPEVRSSNGARAFEEAVFGQHHNGASVDVLDWQIEQRGRSKVVSPQGKIDEATSDAFLQFMRDTLGEEPKLVVIDLSGVERMSSRGLRALTLAQRTSEETGTKLVLANPNAVMSEILAISGYNMVFPTTATVEEALNQ